MKKYPLKVKRRDSLDVVTGHKWWKYFIIGWVKLILLRFSILQENIKENELGIYKFKPQEQSKKLMFYSAYNISKVETLRLSLYSARR